VSNFRRYLAVGALIFALGLVAGHALVSVAGLVTKPNTFVGTTSPQLPWLDSNFDTLYSEFNGNIDDANLKSNAAISQAKILNLVGDLAARLNLAGGQMTGRIDVKMAMPYVRLIGTEASAKDWRMVESAGSLLMQENTGTEATPTWVTRFNLSAGTAGVLPYLARAIDNLVVTRASATTINITADTLVLLDSSGGQFVARNVNVTPAVSNIGVNGLDTGAEAADTWYYAWAIYNGTTVSGLLSTSATAPTMPSGYTHKALVSAVRNDAASDFLAFKQVAGSYLFDAPIKVGDNIGSTTTAAVSLTTAIPPSRVRSVYGKALNNAGSAITMHYHGITFANSQVQDNSISAFQEELNTSRAVTWFLQTLREAQTMYMQLDGGTVDLWVSGFSFDWA